MVRPLSLLVLVLAACGPRPISTTPLVDPPPTPLPAAGIHLTAGEQMEWDVYWQGIQIGRADLTVVAGEAHSRFSTTMLAKAFAKVRYHLITTLDRGTPTAAREALTMDGASSTVVSQIDGSRYAIEDGRQLAVPGGTTLHTLHTALGSLRAWSSSRGEASPAYLWFVLRGTLYRLDVERPTTDEARGHLALKIHGVVRAIDRSVDPIDVTVWLSATTDRAPLRFVVLAEGERISAELTETTAKLAGN
ncbi:MAG: DUF3108 domain-containing protein [Deltaproteobacteria bacterium]|nr:DUF3108 domain-containing protein [Deltaproteobacteria bacterium]